MRGLEELIIQRGTGCRAACSGWAASGLQLPPLLAAEHITFCPVHEADCMIPLCVGELRSQSAVQLDMRPAFRCFQVPTTWSVQPHCYWGVKPPPSPPAAYNIPPISIALGASYFQRLLARSTDMRVSGAGWACTLGRIGCCVPVARFGLRSFTSQPAQPAH